MKKLFKVFVILVAIGIFLIAVGTILLRIYLPPEKAKALVLAQLSKQLKRDVQVDSVSVGLLSGLQMNGLKISESPNFSQGIFVSSELFALKIALTPLLFRKVVVRQIMLRKPEVNVMRFADGKTFNFSDLTGSTTSQASTPQTGPAGSKEAPPFLLLVSHAEIQKGALHFIDHSPAQQSVDIAPFDLKLKNVSLTTPFSIQTAMHVKSKGTDLAIHFAGQANLVKGSFAIKQGSIMSQNTKITLAGELERLKTPDPAVNLSIDIPQLKVGDLAPFVALPPTIKIEKPIKGKASIKGDQNNIDVQSQLSLESMQLTGHGRIQHVTATPVVAFHVETNAFPIQDVLKYSPDALPQGVAMDGTTRLSADVSGTTANTQFGAKWSGTELHIVKGNDFAKPAGFPFEVSLTGNRSASGDVLVKNLVAKLGVNEITGAGTYQPSGPQGAINFSAKGSNWAIADLAKVSPLLAPYHPTGTLSFDLHSAGPTNAPQTTVQTAANVAISQVKQEFYEGQDLHLVWNLKDITPDLAKVSGTATLKQGAGKILNVEKLAATSRVGKIALAPLETLAKLQKKGVLERVNLPSLQTIPFDSLVGDYLLRSGTMDIKVFDLNGKDLSVQNRGTVGLAGVQPINMNVAMKLAAGSVGGTLGEIIKDESGRPTLKFTAAGSVADPKVKWDVQEVGKKALQEAGKEILKNKDVQNAVDDLQKTFKGLFH